MKLLYVTDVRLFYNENGFYKKEYIEPDEIGAINDNVSEVVFWGRLDYAKDVKGLPLLKSDKYKLTVLGNKNQKRGLSGYIRGLFNTFKVLGKEVRDADIIWLKFSFFSSYAAGLFLTKKVRRKKVILSQLIGDFDCILLIYQGLFFKFVANASKCLYRKIIKRCDLQIYVSHMLEKEYKVDGIKSMVLNENKTKIHNIIAPENIHHRGKDELLRLIFAGRLSPEKRIFDIIKAAQNTDGVVLSILGDGLQKEQIKDYIKSHKLDEKIALYEPISWGDELFSFIRDHHALVLPSQSEGLPLVLLEAMSCGVSVIASCVGGIPEIVKDGKNGQLFTAGNTDELIKCIEKIRDDEMFRVELIKNSLKTAHENCFEKQLSPLSDAVREIFKNKQI